MRVPKYVEVSDDLRLSRKNEAGAHREFLQWEIATLNRIIAAYYENWPARFEQFTPLPFSHAYDADVAA